jgi:Raf kinase inhibitor-like YbhB/YbcL family protein
MGKGILAERLRIAKRYTVPMKTGSMVGVTVALALLLGLLLLMQASQRNSGTDGSMSGISALFSNAMPMTLTSPAFAPNGSIPQKYACDGAGVSLPLSWSGAPNNTKSYALVMDDPDIPESVKVARGIDVFDHWVVYNISPDTTKFFDGQPVGIAGLNGAGVEGYAAPCPPDGEHRYFIYLFALDTTLSFDSPPTKQQLLDAMQGHVIGKAELIGRYAKQT